MEVLLCLFAVLCNVVAQTTHVAAYLDDDNLIFGYFTPWGLGIPLALGCALIIATIIACIADFKNGSKGVKTDTDHFESEYIFSPSGGSKRETTAETQEDKEIPVPMSFISAAELETEATQRQFSQVTDKSGRLDHQEKHARIIEAIYHASGRELPQMYRSGRRTIFVEGTQSGSKEPFNRGGRLSVVNENDGTEKEVSEFFSQNSEGTLAKSATPSPMPDEARAIARQMGRSAEVTGLPKPSERSDKEVRSDKVERPAADQKSLTDSEKPEPAKEAPSKPKRTDVTAAPASTATAPIVPPETESHKAVTEKPDPKMKSESNSMEPSAAEKPEPEEKKK